MPLNLTFTKMVGTGNDFILLDNRSEIFPVEKKNLISFLCDRRKGIGGDGIILLEEASQADFRMRIFNPDGSEAEMCGNGARCLIGFARSLGFDRDILHVETQSGEIQAHFEREEIVLNMGQPKDFREKMEIVIEGQSHEVFFVDTGVPHAVIFVPEVSSVPLQTLGRSIRNREEFQPEGCNCNFVEITGKQSLKVRTYERGVETETFSCGTGTCASAIVAVLEKGLHWPVTSETPLGELLHVDSKITKEQQNRDFFLKGPISVCFTGTVSL